MNTDVITVTSVPNHQRSDFWQTHFGNVKGFSTFEVVIFTTMVQWWADYLDANREQTISPFDFAKLNNPMNH